MRVLVTGANGFLGQHLCLYLQKAGFEVIATGRGPSRIHPDFSGSYYAADLGSEQAATKLVADARPDCIVHAAAISKPDECADNEEQCYRMNTASTIRMAEAAGNSNIHFIFISTDFVFGEDGPHDEDAPKDPLNTYGLSKLKAEEHLVNMGHNFTIVRIAFVFGPVWPGLRPSFIQWVRLNLEAGKTIKVVSDQLRTPTFVQDICAGLETIIKHREKGIFHLSGDDAISPYELALKVAAVSGLNPDLIDSVTASTFPEKVLRAKRSGLKTGKAKAVLHYVPTPIDEALGLSLSSHPDSTYTLR